MAQDTTTHQREGQSQQTGSTQQAAQPSSAAAQSGAATTSRSGAGGSQSEQQRPIETGRETSGGSAGVARRPSSGSGYGLAASPFTVMRRMFEDMDRMFQDFGLGGAMPSMSPTIGATTSRDLWRGGFARDQAIWSPQVETFRRGDTLVVRADLPGLNRDDVRVEIDDGVLTISGERADESEETRDDYYRSERTYGEFFRAIPLPEGVDADQAQATFKDGVLEVTLNAPREQERSARRIPVR